MQKLPPSLTFLELDTKCWENTKSADQNHNICELISLRQPRVEHLRLRLNRLCTDLIVGSPVLKSAVINMLSSDYTTETGQCGEEDFIQSDRWGLREEAGHRTLRGIIEHTTSQLPELPNLEKMLVVESQMYKDGFYDIIKVRDIKAKKTTVSRTTYAQINMESCPILHLRYRDRDGTIKDVVGHYANIEELLEGPAWCSTTSGSRFPATFKDSPEGRGYRWAQYDRYRTKDQILDEGKEWHVPFFGDERDVECFLVEPFEVDGLGDVEAPVKEKCQDDIVLDEEYYENGNQYGSAEGGELDSEDCRDREDDEEDSNKDNEETDGHGKALKRRET